MLYAAKIAPGLKPYAAYLLSRILLIRRLGGGDAKALDVLLAMAPWKDAEAYGRYCDAVETGKLPAAMWVDRLLLAIGQDLLAEVQAAYKSKWLDPTPFPAFTPKVEEQLKDTRAQ